MFSEDFADPSSFAARFDHGWSGEVAAGLLFGDNANDWSGDHDMSCGDPNASHRTIHVTPGPGEPGVAGSSVRDVEQAFYPCLPGGDPAKGHVMTSVNTEGYVTAWFSPKQTFTNVHRVCWDQNLTDLGGGKWTQVVFLTAGEAARLQGGKPDLGFTSPEFQGPAGPSTPQGAARYGVKLFDGGAQSWAIPSNLDPDSPSQVNWFNIASGGPGVATTGDKAPRYQQCVTDQDNGTLSWTRQGPNGTVTGTSRGQIPNEPIRVVFEDDNYNPDKHFSNDAPKARDSSGLYTWHWDNIQIG